MFLIFLLVLSCLMYFFPGASNDIKKREILDYNGRKIEFVLTNPENDYSWYEALAYCHRQNRDLVSIDSMKKQTFITDVVKRIDIGVLWIGYKNDLPETLNELEITGRKANYWVWLTDNKVSSFTNWCSGQPSRTSKENGRDLCATVSKYDNCWSTRDCIGSPLLAWICEDRSTAKVKRQRPKSIDKVTHDTRNYYFHNEVDVSWMEALKRCTEKNQKLAIFETEKKYEFLKEEIKKRNLNYWIGLVVEDRDASEIWKWYWKGHETREFHSNWCAPDKTRMGFHDHCALVTADEVCWKNWYCENDDGPANGIICEDTEPLFDP